MAETLCSVGLDVGTTSTQMVVSELLVENQASGFAVPEFTISNRKILYRSQVYFTPMLSESLIDAEALKELVEKEYAAAGISRETVDTGAVIITGETSRKENAGAVLNALSHLAGDFVVAAAGPDLESRLAAMGAGAAEYSRKTGKTVLHMDIGGGTSNLALIQRGEIVDTGCINVGGRLIRFDREGIIQYVSPVLKDLTELKPGDRITREQADGVCRMLTQILEMAAGLREPTEALQRLITREGKLLAEDQLQPHAVISFSGGVADCIGQETDWMAYGDLGPLLGRAIRNSRLCTENFQLGKETIRATVIGAGCHSTQLSGSTVYNQNVEFPLQNIPVVPVPAVENLRLGIRSALSRQDEPVFLSLQNVEQPSYEAVRFLAQEIADGMGSGPCYLCLGQDMAKALGQALALRMGRDAQILCLDRIALGNTCYLDVGRPVGPALPVVVKTLILGNQE